MKYYSEIIEKLLKSDSFRQIQNIESKSGKYLFVNGKKMLNLSSNDYLNLSTDKDLIEEFLSKYSQNKEFIFSSASSRLLTGTSHIYKRLENNLAKIFNKEACLLFNTGYQCNLGVVSTLIGRDDVIFSDKLNHASIIDGMKLSGAKFYRYKHLDYDNLENQLKSYRNSYKKAIIISESVFSMDGDVSNINRLIELKKEYDCMLMIDEAHAFGIYGKNLAGKFDGIKDIDIITATLGKSIASVGAFCVSSKTIIDYLINKANSFIFSTALPSVNVLWTNFLIEEKYEKVKQQSEKLRKLVKSANDYIEREEETQIVPVVIGENDKTIKVAEYLKSKGFYVLAIRPPTVPVGSSRLRLSLTSDITFEEIKSVIDTVSEVI